MHHLQQIQEIHRHRRSPAGWPGLTAATRLAAARDDRHGAWADGQDDDRAIGDLQIRILDRMAKVLTTLVTTQDHARVVPDDLGLVALMTADLDRHLTTLMDARYEPADDARVLAIEHALLGVRERLVALATR